MIELIFYFGTDIILVKVIGNHVSFRSSVYGLNESTIEGLKLDYQGVIKEFPDLETQENWRQIAIDRFKEKIRSMKTEDETAQYIINDLRKFGYIPKFKQKAGYRKEAII